MTKTRAPAHKAGAGTPRGDSVQPTMTDGDDWFSEFIGLDRVEAELASDFDTRVAGDMTDGEIAELTQGLPKPLRSRLEFAAIALSVARASIAKSTKREVAHWRALLAEYRAGLGQEVTLRFVDSTGGVQLQPAIIDGPPPGWKRPQCFDAIAAVHDALRDIDGFRPEDHNTQKVRSHQQSIIRRTSKPDAVDDKRIVDFLRRREYALSDDKADIRKAAKTELGVGNSRVLRVAKDVGMTRQYRRSRTRATPKP